MKHIIYAAVLLFSYCSVQGRRYGYGKKKPKPVPVPIPDFKIPHCNVGCTRQWIPPECREETYGFENGVKCKGCDRDICRGPDFTGVGNIGFGRLQSGRDFTGVDNIGIDRWQSGRDFTGVGNIGLDRWQSGNDFAGVDNLNLDRLQSGRDWQDGRKRKNNGKLNKRRNRGRGKLYKRRNKGRKIRLNKRFFGDNDD